MIPTVRRRARQISIVAQNVDHDVPILIHAGVVPDAPDASVIITSNRGAEIQAALDSVLAQEGCSVEVIVIDDCSSDNVGRTVAERFPNASVYRCRQVTGYIWARNFAASVAHAPVLFSLDDDARYTDPRTVLCTLLDFDVGGDIGAVAMPYREPRPDGRVFEVLPTRDDATFCTDAYVGTAYAVRREVFQRLGGYRAALIHQGEERDFCLRMLQAGYVVRLGTAPPLIHRPSMQRNRERISYYGRRNDALFTWQNVPTRSFPMHALRTTASGLLGAATIASGRFAREMLTGMVAGWRETSKHDRRPADFAVYELSLRLRRRGPLPLATVRGRLADVAPRVIVAGGAAIPLASAPVPYE